MSLEGVRHTFAAGFLCRAFSAWRCGGLYLGLRPGLLWGGSLALNNSGWRSLPALFHPALFVCSVAAYWIVRLMVLVWVTPPPVAVTVTV